MRRVKLFSASSLDAFIARKDGAVDWLFTDGDYGYSPFYESIDTLLMGRKTYEQILSFGPYPYPRKKAYVFSHSRAGDRDENVEFISGVPSEIVANLRDEPGKDIWLVGGAVLTTPFLRDGLVDDIIVTVHPILLGDGIPMFPIHEGETKLKLTESVSFDSGLVQLHYRRRPEM